MKKLLPTILIFLSIYSFLAQETEPPISLNWPITPQERLVLPTIDLSLIKKEDSINDLDKTIPWRYGILRPIALNTQNSGLWTTLPNGDKVWRLAITSPGAVNLSLNFNTFNLPTGSTLQLYNGSKDDFSKVYNPSNNRNSNTLGSWFLEGNTIVVQYYQSSLTSTIPQLEIGSLIHGYRMGLLDPILEAERGLEDSGDCNYDVNCSVGSDFEDKKNILKKAVALLNLGNGTLCTATLLNNTLEDKTPYLLTANHCLQNSNPDLWSVRFNWVSPTPVCGGEEGSLDIQTNFTISGATPRAHNTTSDFALVELVNPIPDSWDLVFAGWDRTDAIPLYQVGIHHPQGDIMKICRDNDPMVKEIANGTKTWLIKGASAGNGNGWDLGITESGSSGSALFNDKGHLIGQLYAGLAACNGENTNNEFDLYGRFAISWQEGTNETRRLKDWLDPNNTNVTILGHLENSLSIGEFIFEGQLSVYPNPASSFIMVMNSQYPNLSYQLFDSVGRQMQAGAIPNTENRIEVQSLNEGIYFLVLFDEDSSNSITKKLIIKK